MNCTAYIIVSFGFTIMGMAGLYKNVPYSGWVLFVGLIVALFGYGGGRIQKNSIKMNELWIIEVSFDGYNWKPELDLVYETGKENAEKDALLIEKLVRQEQWPAGWPNYTVFW